MDLQERARTLFDQAENLRLAADEIETVARDLTDDFIITEIGVRVVPPRLKVSAIKNAKRERVGIYIGLSPEAGGISPELLEPLKVAG